MANSNTSLSQEVNTDVSTAKNEWICLLLTVLIIFPVLSLFLIGAYGFIVWMSQVFIFGPPGADDCGTD